jgi:hypothetical protein
MLKFKRILVSILCASLVPLVAWVGGMDFDQRSPQAASVMVVAIYVFGVIFFFSGTWENENI